MTEIKRITEQEAERRLIKLRGDMLHRAKYRLPIQDAEEAVQDAQYRAWEMAPTVFDASTGDDGFYRWSMRILAFVIHEFSRRHKSCRETLSHWDGDAKEENDSAQFGESEPNTEDKMIVDFERNQDREAIFELAAASGLSVRQHEIIDMVMEGSPTGDIARSLGITVKNVNAQLSAARAKMIATKNEITMDRLEEIK